MVGKIFFVSYRLQTIGIHCLQNKFRWSAAHEGLNYLFTVVRELTFCRSIYTITTFSIINQSIIYTNDDT